MSDRDRWHRDSKGNEHFYAHDAEWADRDARQQKASSGSGRSRSSPYWDSDRWHVAVIIPFVAILLECQKLWGHVEKAMKGAGFSERVAEWTGIAAGIALLALAATCLLKAPSPPAKIAVTILFAVVAGYFIF